MRSSSVDDFEEPPEGWEAVREAHRLNGPYGSVGHVDGHSVRVGVGSSSMEVFDLFYDLQALRMSGGQSMHEDIHAVLVHLTGFRNNGMMKSQSLYYPSMLAAGLWR